MCTPGKLRFMPSHGGNRIYDFWNASRTMLCQLSYAVRSVRVCGISDLGLITLTYLHDTISRIRYYKVSCIIHQQMKSFLEHVQ